MLHIDKLHHIPIKHQITTVPQTSATGTRLHHIPIKHQITTRVCQARRRCRLHHIPIKHQITTRRSRFDPRGDCITFQLSIKSQPGGRIRLVRQIASHSN